MALGGRRTSGVAVNFWGGQELPALITSSSAAPILSFGKAELMTILEAAGVVLLRGFSVNVETFSAYVAANSSRVTLDPHRRFHSANAQLVDAGNQSIEMHAENGNTPFRPDFIWFYCNRMASSGGQTTFCDGLRVWQGFSDATRGLFSAKQVRYKRVYPGAMWRAYVAHLLNDGTTLADINEAQVRKTLGTELGVEVRLQADDSLDTCFTRPAYYLTLFGQRCAFTNSILGPYGGQEVTLEKGERIPQAVLEEIRQTYEKFTQEIPWQDQDVAIIDNTRFLHGRRSFTDNRRQIFSALSFA